MAIPKKNDIVHQRDENNELIPQVVELKTVSDSSKRFLEIPEDEPIEFKMLPAKQGELSALMQKAEQQEAEQDDPEDVTSEELEFVCDKLIEPDLDPEDLEAMPTQDVAGGALIALISISTGTPQEDVAEAIEESIDEEGTKEELFREDSDGSEAESSESGEEGGSGEGSEEAS